MTSYEDIVEKDKEYLIQCVPRQPVALTEEKGVLICLGGVRKCTMRMQPCLTITKK
ncbi:hypothetical protein GWO13_03750 [Candidatus Bathyarchaeota archaeon]|nr:hypothetical protein [Candidatus Bathyarchaeota archaeon]